MRLILCAVKSSLADAWTQYCGDLDFVTIHHGSILDVECDAVVSPANSFGFMDGGIDFIYMDYFGKDIQLKVRRQIFDHHHGELIVGNADIVETGNSKIPYLIAAPTMRVPMVLHDGRKCIPCCTGSIYIGDTWYIYIWRQNRRKNIRLR